jgi:hypothetical protein
MEPFSAVRVAGPPKPATNLPASAKILNSTQTSQTVIDALSPHLYYSPQSICPAEQDPKEKPKNSGGKGGS